MNKVEKVLSCWKEGIITEGELHSQLFDCFGEVGPRLLAESLPEDIKKEFVESVRGFLSMPPEDVLIIVGATFVNEEAYKNYLETQKKRLNSFRPRMREFLNYVQQK